MKAIFTHIKTSLKPALSVFLATVVVYSGLLLCCQVGLTSVHSQWGKAKTCCHLSKMPQFKEKADATCQCCGVIKNILDRAKETVTMARSVSLIDVNYIAVVDKVWRFSNPKIVLIASSQGPPQSVRSTPLYIQHSNLRL